MGNSFCHVELTTPDVAKAKTFYSQLFDWNLEDAPMGGGMTYTLIKPKDGTGGGMMEMKNVPPGWLAYVLVDDIKASTAKAKSLGATMIRENEPVAEIGWMTIFTDPTGAMLALWQQNSK
jgi:uncharacterized protein